MKISKDIAGITIMLLAAVGAFATTTHQRSNTYFYQSGSGGCKSITRDFSCIPGGTGCTSVVGTGAQPKQLFLSQLTVNTCRTPLKVA
ncbi:hypothetical protein [Pedobacter sp.]|jgi:hypothetical protein|uniref:hypothetical protein n=1 Tax=Pedobacter sp. TaxID=1411316 RepID=UPI002B87D677|nr:hypothetical protein [Pedobacter sp.]HWW37879.1 hypothetical protein [Pedobacter sp.]